MEKIHALISSGQGTKEHPFVLDAPGHSIAVRAEREIVETMVGAKYDDVLVRRVYFGQSLCATVVRDGEGEREIWFDLKSAVEESAKRQQVLDQIFSTPEGKVAEDKMRKEIARILLANIGERQREALTREQQNERSSIGFLLVVALVVVVVVAVIFFWVKL
jgi:predicted nucleic acid-binding Zn ribbon protein